MLCHGVIPDCSCVNISSDLQPSYDGYYYSLNETVNGQSLYKRRDCDLYLFLYLGIASYRVVGPRPGSNRGMLINSAILEALEDTRRWNGYNSTDDEFEEDPSVIPSCSCPGNWPFSLLIRRACCLVFTSLYGKFSEP